MWMLKQRPCGNSRRLQLQVVSHPSVEADKGVVINIKNHHHGLRLCSHCRRHLLVGH